MAPDPRPPGRGRSGGWPGALLILVLVVGRAGLSGPAVASRPRGSPEDQHGSSAALSGRFAMSDAAWNHIRGSIENDRSPDVEGRSGALSAAVGELLRDHPRLDSRRIRGGLGALHSVGRRLMYLESRAAMLEAARVEAAAEEVRARGLGEYVIYEDRSQRVEERDILHRLCTLLEGDLAQAERELRRSHRINHGAGANVEVESIQGQEERTLAYRARLSSIGEQRDALETLAPAALASSRAAGKLAAYHGRRESLLSTRRDALLAEQGAARAWARAEEGRLRAALAAIVLGQHPDTGAETDWGQACPGLQEDAARVLLERCPTGNGGGPSPAGRDRLPGGDPCDFFRLEAARAIRLEAEAAHGELMALREALATDLAALDFEAEVLEAALLYDAYIIARLEAHVARLDARAQLTEDQLRYARLRLGRAEVLLAHTAVGAQEPERDARLVDHFDHASQRSWSDQATLRRLLVAMESVGRADRESRPAIARYRSAVEGSLALASGMVDASSLGGWSPALPALRHVGPPPSNPADGLAAVEEAIRAASRDLDLLVDEELHPFRSPRQRVAEGLVASLGGVELTDVGRIVPLRTLRRYSSNDPGPIQVRGPEDILRTALELKGEELREWRRTAAELAGD